MKHFRNWFFLLFLVLIGCSSASIDGNISIKVNQDGSGQYQFSFLTHPVILPYLEEYKKELIQQQFEIKEITKEDQVGWIATKNTKNIQNEPLPTAIPVSTPKQIHSKKVVHIEDGFYWKEIKIDYPLDLTQQEIPSFIEDQIRLSLVITLPVSFQEENATQLSNDEKTATWQLKVGEVNRIYAKVKVPNLTGWLITFIGIFVVLVLSIVYFIRKKRKLTQS